MAGLSARYAHTNLIARDWQALAAFYERVFGSVPVPPVRDLEGDALERGSGVPGARLEGVHLRLPGWGDAEPTLEIFTYSASVERPPVAANRLGFGHLAFAVSDVAAARDEVLAGRKCPQRYRVDSGRRQNGYLGLRARPGGQSPRTAVMVGGGAVTGWADGVDCDVKVPARAGGWDG